MCGLMCNRGKFSPVQWKTAEIKRKCASVKSAELFALDHGQGSFVILRSYTFFGQADKMLMTDSQTSIDSLRSVWPIIDKMNQHLLDNVKKWVDQKGVVVKFIRTGHNLADPLTKRIKDLLSSFHSIFYPTFPRG